MVCICSLRTQQRAKSQCIKHIPPSVGWSPFWGLLHQRIYMSRSLSWSGLSGLVWFGTLECLHSVLCLLSASALGELAVCV